MYRLARFCTVVPLQTVKWLTQADIPTRGHPRKRILSRFTGLYATLIAISLISFSEAIDLTKIRQLAESQYGAKAADTVDSWQAMMTREINSPVQDKLNKVNSFFNDRIRWMPDSQIYGQEDYWATPLETLGRLQADCEDFSIAKYASLIAMGVSSESLRLVYVKALMPNGGSQAHMVLAWYETPQSVPLILDNMNQLLLPASKRTDLKPVFSFNGEGLWLGGNSAPNAAKPQARLSRWRTVLEKMRREGSLENF